MLVPVFMQMPASYVGLGTSMHYCSMALLFSSVASGCTYCQAHTAAFALMRGVPTDNVAAAATGKFDAMSAKDAAIARVVTAVAQVPSPLTRSERHALRAQLSSAEFEAVTLAVAVMGFLNKFMDAVGVDLEAPAAAVGRTAMSEGKWAPKCAVVDADGQFQVCMCTRGEPTHSCQGDIYLLCGNDAPWYVVSRL